MKLPILLSLLLSLSTTLYARPDPASNPIRLRTDRLNSYFVYNCDSWRLAVEVNNKRNWNAVPAECVDYVANYMLVKGDKHEPQYDADLGLIMYEGMEYVSKLTPTPKGKDTWLFGLTNTMISDLPYYSRSDVLFGGLKYNKTKYSAYLEEGNMPEVPYIKDLYEEAKEKGFKIVILSAVVEKRRSTMESNLKKAGFDGWEKLILRYV